MKFWLGEYILFCIITVYIHFKIWNINSLSYFQTQRLNEVKREEFELLEAQSIPLRNYLMKHVMPTLTQGLIDCCKTRPDDPIDYIVSFLII